MKKAKKINILFTTSTLPRWQNDNELRVVLDIAKSLVKNTNTNIHILAPHYPKAKSYEIIEGVTIFRFKYLPARLEKLCYNNGIIGNLKANKLLLLTLPFFTIAQILKTKKLVKRYDIKIIHAHWILPQGLLAVLYKKLFHKDIKIITTLHGSDAYLLNKPFLKKIKDFILHNCDQLTAVSASILNEVKESATNSSIIHNGIDIKKFYKKPKSQELQEKYKINSHCLLFLGRLTKIKGASYLIKAIPEVLKTFPQLKLLIVGDGPTKDKLKTLSHTYKLEKHVIFPGKIPNNKTIDFFNLADIFICPSIILKNKSAEGFGMVILEALACQVPVIGTNTGGIKEIINSGKTGLLVEEKNSEALSSAITKLLNNKILRTKFITGGREQVSNNYSWEIISKEYFTIYQKISNYE